METTNTESFKVKDRFAIKHEGVVSKISEGLLTISLKGNINCEGCKAKVACGVSDSNGKKIELLDTQYNLNESVTVVLKRGLGLKAVFYAYIFPFILVIITLFISSNYLKEWVSGLLALFILLPYYFTLFILKNSFQKTFNISILNNNYT